MLDCFHLFPLSSGITTETPWSEVTCFRESTCWVLLLRGRNMGLSFPIICFSFFFPLLSMQGLPPKRWKADVTHLSCPEPTVFAFSPVAPRRSASREMWIPSFQQSKREAQALRWLVDRNQNFSAQEFWGLVFKD